MELQEVVRLTRERFKDDPRYCPDRAVDGFAFRKGSEEDDSALLDRICAAYIKATERQRSASQTFCPTEWWRRISERSLGPVIKALATRDIDSLRVMYRNFFRDPCSTGLVGLPVDMQQCYFDGPISALHRDYFLGDALHGLDLWKSWTNGRFPLSALTGPDIGNPYGVFIDGVFIRIAAEYQHFYAQEIAGLLGSKKSGTVLEIGGGFGGMAYYLIRDHPGVKYLNFDVPETIALASYYLLKSFPDLNATLYGEARLTLQLLSESEIILMPSCELPHMPDGSVDVSFNSHVLQDMSAQIACEYVDEIIRTTRNYILHLNPSGTCQLISDRLEQKSGRFKLVKERSASWNSAKALHVDEVECLHSA